jgi:hypothetical protein
LALLIGGALILSGHRAAQVPLPHPRSCTGWRS